MSQLIGVLPAIAIAVLGDALGYGVLEKLVGTRLDPAQEFDGVDLWSHQISSAAEREPSW